MPLFEDFLEAEGRTGAISGAVKGFADRAMALRKEAREERAAGQTEEFNELRIQQTRNVLEEQERQTNLRKQTYDVKTDPMFLAAPEDVQQDWLKRGTEKGWWDSTGIGNVGVIQDAMSAVEASKPLFIEMMKPVVASKERIFNNAQLDVKEYEDKQAGKDLSRDKKHQDLVAVRDRARADYSATLNSYTGHQKTLDAFEDAKEDAAEFEADKRDAYLDTFKSVMSATGDIDTAKSAAKEAVKAVFPEAEVPVDRDELTLRRLREGGGGGEIPEAENPLGFTPEELESVGGTAPVGRKTAVSGKATVSKAKQLSDLTRRIPELKRLVKKHKKDKNSKQALAAAKELTAAMKQYKKITGKNYRRK